jgi:hypothetical protein
LNNSFVTKKSITYGAIGLLATILGFLGKAFYRDYILSNSINDWGIAWFLPSYFYVVGFSLLLLIKPTKYSVLIISIVTLASILFEIKQYFSTNFFDVKDILASIAGGLTAFAVLKIVERNNQKSAQTP